MLKVCLHNPIRLQHFIIQWKLNDSHQKMIDRRGIGVGELESEVGFSKKIVFTVFCDKEPLFCKKNVFFIRVDRRVIGVGELEFEVSFSKKIVFTVFCDEGPLFCKKNVFFYKGWPKGNRDRGIWIWGLFYDKICEFDLAKSGFFYEKNDL